MLTVFELVNPLTPALDLGATLEKAAFLFEKTNFSMLPVVRKGIFVGILERKTFPGKNTLEPKTLGDLLVRDMIYLAPTDPGLVAAELLATGLVDLIPVVTEAGSLAGIVTRQEIPPSMWELAQNAVSATEF